jgi:hypothetical protein
MIVLKSGNNITIDYVRVIDIYNKDIIDTIIRERYSASQVEAIVNNYLLDTTNEEYLKEFNDMQEWRKQAKSIAKKVNDFIQENDLINKPDGVYEIKD